VKRLKPKERKIDMLRAGVELAAAGSYLTITMQQIADRAGCSTGLVGHYFPTVASLRKDVVRYGIDQHNHKIILQAMVQDDPELARAPRQVLKAAILALTSL